MNLNKVTIAGNLTRDPELTYSPKGTAVCKIGVAVNESWRGDDGAKKEIVTFLDVTSFGKTAENVGQYFKKGRSIYLEGKLRLDTWDDKQSGQKRSKLNVILDSFQFPDSPADRQASNSAHPATQARPEQARAQAQAARPAAAPVGDGTASAPPDAEDDIPF